MRLRRRHSSTRVGVMSDDDQSNGRDPRSSSASLALSTDSSVSHTPEASDAEDVERGLNVDSDAPPPAEAPDATADEDRARAARPRSSSPWAFPPSAKHAGGRNAPNVLPVVSPPVKKDRRKSNTYLMIGVGLCIGVVISLLLIINCVFLARIDDGIRTGGVNTNFWTTSSPPPPPPQVSSPPPPPPPPVSSPTTPSTPVSSPAGPVEYKVVSFNSEYYEGCDRSPSQYCYDFGEFSFVDVMKSEGLTDDDIFTACSYEKQNGRGKSYKTGGVQTDCVIEKFVAKLGQANWTLYLSPTNVDTVASWHFTRPKATSS